MLQNCMKKMDTLGVRYIIILSWIYSALQIISIDLECAYFVNYRSTQVLVNLRKYSRTWTSRLKNWTVPSTTFTAQLLTNRRWTICSKKWETLTAWRSEVVFWILQKEASLFHLPLNRTMWTKCRRNSINSSTCEHAKPICFRSISNYLYKRTN